MNYNMMYEKILNNEMFSFEELKKFHENNIPYDEDVLTIHDSYVIVDRYYIIKPESTKIKIKLTAKLFYDKTHQDEISQPELVNDSELFYICEIYNEYEQETDSYNLKYFEIKSTFPTLKMAADVRYLFNEKFGSNVILTHSELVENYLDFLNASQRTP